VLGAVGWVPAWVDLLPTAGGLTPLPPAIQAEILAGLDEAMRAIDKSVHQDVCRPWIAS
jgi:hypothetical protein